MESVGGTLVSRRRTLRQTQGRESNHSRLEIKRHGESSSRENCREFTPDNTDPVSGLDGPMLPQVFTWKWTATASVRMGGTVMLAVLVPAVVVLLPSVCRR